MTGSLALVIGGGAFVTTLLAAVAIYHATHDDAPAAPLAPAAGPSAVMPAAAPSGVVRTLGYLALPESPSERQSVEDALAQAGWRSRAAPTTYFAVRTGLALLLPLLLEVTLRPGTLLGGLLLAIEGVALGYYLPSWVVAWRRGRRQRAIRHAVPNMLDMLVSCVEAGLGIDVAMRHVSKEIGNAAPELGEELDLTNAEIAAGIPRVDALKNLERRTGVEDLSSLVNVLGIVERFGAGIAQSLRAHAQLTRRRRALDAEKRAANASPKLTVVMILFILPVLFVVLLGSTIVNVVTWVIPQLQGY